MRATAPLRVRAVKEIAASAPAYHRAADGLRIARPPFRLSAERADADAASMADEGPAGFDEPIAIGRHTARAGRLPRRITPRQLPSHALASADAEFTQHFA